MAIKLDEFNKAEQMLKDRGLTYIREDKIDPTLCGTYERHIIKAVDDDGKWVWDFICSTGSYGSEAGLLEYWSKKSSDAGLDPVGWLNAEEVIAKIEGGE